MCGIFGVVCQKTQAKKLMAWTDELFRLSQSRGKEASGLALIEKGKVEVYKRALSSTELVTTGEYKKLFKTTTQTPLGVIGHSRLATNGAQSENRNNQPVYNDFGLVVHNGIIVNDADLWSRNLKSSPRNEVDTEVILALIQKNYKEGYSLEDATSKAFAKIEGSASIALVLAAEPYLTLATNTGSLYFFLAKKEKAFFFASEFYILDAFQKRFFRKKSEIKQIKAGGGTKVNLLTLKIQPFKLTENGQKRVKTEVTNEKAFSIKGLSEESRVGNEVTILLSQDNNLSRLKKHDFNYDSINKLTRCVRCILPKTMPFIKFDDAGVCNYCTNHKKIRPKGVGQLEKIVSTLGNKNSKADCIVAFSGGRDSSYGLHYLKKELSLNPIAYTYDWGMVTDLARRNQARIVGKLGVEHLIVSANIAQKRSYIRNHILAWLKRPELGMVPLFMEGDKQCVYYADQLAERLGIKLVVYCRGNELENEEFKWGHCGIKEGSPGGVIHDLSTKGKFQIALYYGLEYLKNPSYINSSIFDTLFSYFSTYIQKHNYLFLWHYIPWNEEKIVSTLKDSYGWETEPESNATWRIDDGSSAFYNYIYLRLQGFTENDTFRSNQIREGILSRKEALKLVDKENIPRYEALKWYFDRVGLEGDKVLSAIDNMPVFY
jgi:predicted glutamine amidotransferase